MGEGMKIWLTIWVKPRETVRYAIEKKPFGYVLVLVALFGINHILGLPEAEGWDFSFPIVLLLSLFVGLILGFVKWFVEVIIYQYIGKAFGGKGQIREMMYAAAFANIPIIWSMILWIPANYYLGGIDYSTDPELTSTQLTVFAIIGAIEIMLIVWSIIILVQAIKEVHRISGLKSIILIIINGIILMYLVDPIVEKCLSLIS